MENLLIIDVLFTSMQVNEIKEIVTYGWGNFLGKFTVTAIMPVMPGSNSYQLYDRQLYPAFRRLRQVY